MATSPNMVLQPTADANAPKADSSPGKLIAQMGPQRARMDQNLQMVMDIWGGTTTMRKAAQRWLPQEQAENITVYLNRLNRSVFFNGYKKAIQDLAGRPFSKPLVISDKVPDEVVNLLDDVDRTGRHIDVFAKDFFELAMRDGLRVLLVDYPQKNENIANLAQEREAGNRPYWVEVNAVDIIGFRYQLLDGLAVITHFRFYEYVIEDLDDFGEQEISQIRVLEPGKWQIWRRDTDPKKPDNWIMFKEGVTTMKKIPIVVMYTGRVGVLEAGPPLLDLAWENIHHWQSSSDQNNILHAARVPILFLSGFNEIDEAGNNKKIVIAPNTAISSKDPQAKMEWVEHKGSAIKAGADDIKESEGRMAVLGIQALMKRRSVSVQKTATETIVDADADFSDLAGWARNEEDALEEAIELTAEWLAVDMPDDNPDERWVTINKDWNVSLSSTDAPTLQALWISRAISHKTLLAELQRRALLNPALDIDDEIEAAKNEEPPLGAMPGFGQKGGAAKGGSSGTLGSGDSADLGDTGNTA